MSHQPERKEKNCLNCGTTVAGRYCQVCGQENIVNKQTIWGLIRHFIFDIFHFDGKFFDTLKQLLFRPGYIPQQYVQGKRVSYLDPIRMYLFTSAIFFLIYLSIKDPVTGLDNDNYRVLTRTERFDHASALYSQKTTDSNANQQIKYLMDTTYRIILATDDRYSHKDSTFYPNKENKKERMIVYKKPPPKLTIEVGGSNWLGRKLDKVYQDQKRKYGDDTKSFLKDMGKTFFHLLPYMLFISLPFFALILKLLYARKKQFYYSDHAVFTLYHYILSFILLLFVLFLEWLDQVAGGWFFSLMATLTVLSGGLYLLLAMKRFYRQGWGKTLLKFIILNMLAFIMILALVLIFLLFSVFQL